MTIAQLVVTFIALVAINFILLYGGFRAMAHIGLVPKDWFE